MALHTSRATFMSRGSILVRESVTVAFDKYTATVAITSLVRNSYSTFSVSIVAYGIRSLLVPVRLRLLHRYPKALMPFQLPL